MNPSARLKKVQFTDVERKILRNFENFCNP